ncbi:transmembrane protein 106B [Oncorhynchus tshawytscha]|uniref:Transmembrane protein 106B n=1 Tax=Oncorhynchus tshawytscha TaxID=74940 RepID=A0A8C8EHX1_ONCTS|nr:transmembrane protein 106B [Oncorhynchus tshawytscha]XP_024289128.1 transmembrane protein 106B [Oncorhynchus tshawytscha]XP_024289129.1 transmembrane protein 106B [Oncorhynchus tshawytscha]
MGAGSSQPSENDEQSIVPQQDRRKTSNRRHSEETLDCPTCQGTGRIPRGQESKLVAVIPCSDQRLKPQHTKLYVTVSVTLCLLVSSLVLFFLFPRSVILSPVAVKSVYVYFTPTTVQMNITNILNITNDNFFTVQAYNLTVQALFDKTVVGKADMKNVTTVKPLTDKTFAFEIPVTLVEEGLNNYCKKSTIKIHTLFVHLQMSMTVYYLAHFEQLSLDTFEYIDCGSNTTTPHLINPTP